MLESKRRAAIFLLLAFLLALTAGYLVFDKVKQLNAELGGMTEVYVATEDIPARSPIKESQLTTEEIPVKFLNENWHVAVDKDSILNKVPVVTIAKGEIITTNIIRESSIATDENKRLISMFPTETVQFDQEVEALDRVDIVVSTENDGKPKTEFFMKDVLVYWAQKDGEANGIVGAALEVNVEDAPKLIHMQHYADKIRILKASAGKVEQTEQPKEKEAAPKEEVPNEEAPAAEGAPATPQKEAE